MTVQADPNTTVDPQQSRVGKHITIELPPSAKAEALSLKAKSPSTPDESPEQRFMRIVQKTPLTKGVQTSSFCNQYTKPCFSW